MSSPLDTLSLLRKLVAIRSVVPHEAELAAFLEEYLERLGFGVERVLTDGDRPNLVATLGRARRFLGFYGHMDTVPPASDYVGDPFEARCEGDIVRGLGVCDMKGGLACILQVAAWAAGQRIPLKLVFGVDEEAISQGAHDLVDSGLMRDIAFLVVAESGQIDNLEQQFSVCLGRKGRLVLEIEVSGRAAHAAESHKGVNAIEQASLLVPRLAELPFVPHPRLGRSAVVVQEIASRCDAFSVPDRCTLTVSVLTTPGTTGADCERRLLELGRAQGLELRIRPKPRKTPYGEAYEIDVSDPFYQVVAREVLAPSGVRPGYAASVADENVFAHRLGIPVLSLGVVGGGDHTGREWARLSSFDSVIAGYRRIAALWQAL